MIRRNTARTCETLGPDAKTTILMGTCPPEMFKQFAPQQHLFTSYEALHTHLVAYAHNQSEPPMSMDTILVDAALVKGAGSQRRRPTRRPIGRRTTSYTR